ncbi:hypothetical protein HZA96_00390 [Candidatus Woesearchaeota archaeon]|nr:hypothetical protein [Candidatus Woesearchaeota archaeon]
MIIYNPHNEQILSERVPLAEQLLTQISAKYCFISGSFLYKEKYEDIDIFIVSRSKRKVELENSKIKITLIDFNNLHSLFYHSVSKSCIAKNILPKKQLKVTIADYWDVINEAVPTIINQKDAFHKSVRFLILYTEYFKNKIILDTFELNKEISQYQDYKQLLGYISEKVPITINKKVTRSYIRRFFYTQAALYKDLFDYPAQRFLYNLCHTITRGITYDQS